VPEVLNVVYGLNLLKAQPPEAVAPFAFGGDFVALCAITILSELSGKARFKPIFLLFVSKINKKHNEKQRFLDFGSNLIKIKPGQPCAPLGKQSKCYKNATKRTSPQGKLPQM